MKYSCKSDDRRYFIMKVVVVKSPKLLAPMLRLIFRIKKEPQE